MRVADLKEGDRVELLALDEGFKDRMGEPLLGDSDEHYRMASESEYLEVSAINREGEDGEVTVIYSEQGNWAVPTDLEIKGE